MDIDGLFKSSLPSLVLFLRQNQTNDTSMENVFFKAVDYLNSLPLEELKQKNSTQKENKYFDNKITSIQEQLHQLRKLDQELSVALASIDEKLRIAHETVVNGEQILQNDFFAAHNRPLPPPIIFQELFSYDNRSPEPNNFVS